MSVARLRCTSCRGYFPRDEVYYENRVSRICSEECFHSLYEKQRSRARVKAAKAKRKPKESRLDAELRRIVRARDGNVCRWCGQQGQQIHHILYRSQGGPDLETNLVLLCTEHHGMVHSNKGHWQPTLLALLWLGYCEGRWMTVPEVERLLLRERVIEPIAA